VVKLEGDVEEAVSCTFPVQVGQDPLRDRRREVVDLRTAGGIRSRYSVASIARSACLTSAWISIGTGHCRPQARWIARSTVSVTWS
jgi:hypothetical protein